MACHVRQAHALAPIPFVWIDAGVEAAGKELRKAFTQRCHLFFRKQALDDQESVTAKTSDFGISQPSEERQGESGHFLVPSGGFYKNRYYRLHVRTYNE